MVEYIAAEENVIFGKRDNLQSSKAYLGNHQRDVIGRQRDPAKIVTLYQQLAFREQVQLFQQRDRDS